MKFDSGEATIQESVKQNIVRFFNRLLSPEVIRQNALVTTAPVSTVPRAIFRANSALRI